MNLNKLDYLIVSILALGAIRGNFQGLIGAAGGIVTNIVSIVVAWRFRPVLTDYLEDRFGIVSLVVRKVESHLSLPIDTANQDQIIRMVAFDHAQALLHGQITEFSYLFVSALIFLLLYMISSCLLRLIFLTITRIMEHGVVGSFNRLGGIILVTSQTIIIMAVLAGILANPINLGADLGVKYARGLQVWLGESLFFPYLLKIWGLMLSMLGIGA